jgi:hypothetical protein
MAYQVQEGLIRNVVHAMMMAVKVLQHLKQQAHQHIHVVNP